MSRIKNHFSRDELRFEVRRKLFHIIAGSSGVFLIYIGIIDPLIIFLMLIAGILSSLISRYHSIHVISWFLDVFERPDLRKKFPGKGVIFLCIGFLLSLKLFPHDIALASLMIVTLGDSVSHLVGHYAGSIRNPLNGSGYKLLEGTIAGTFSGFMGAILFVSPIMAFFGSLVAMIAEAVEVDFNKNSVDDNIIVPLVAGTAMVAVRNNWIMLLWDFLRSFWVF